MKFNRALLLYNRNAGQQEIVQQLAAIIPILAGEIKELVLYQTTEPGEGEQVCRDRGERFELILIMGGDGSVHECVNGIVMLELRRLSVFCLPAPVTILRVRLSYRSI
ncbi:iron (III) dicitrate transport system [Paenibacillus sp. JCM 10914]|nr:iron (III) dicitrate transport system [Paenibacillus sp. JCM 10914]